MRAARAVHRWVRGGGRLSGSDRVRRAAFRISIDAHRNRRGPYTAAGELARRLAPQLRDKAPGLVGLHELTLLSLAPELRDRLPASPEVAASFAFSREGDHPSWTRRLAHGATDFLLDYGDRLCPRGLRIEFQQVDAADPTDQEFIAVLLRRADPHRVAVTVGTASDELDAGLLDALRAYAEPGPPPAADPSATTNVPLDRLSAAAVRRLARRYVESDLTLACPLAGAAYERLPAPARHTLHRQRIAQLEARGEESLALGALPLHQECLGDKVEPLVAASSRCMRLAYYAAGLDWAERARAMALRQMHKEAFGEATRNAFFALLLLGRFEEVERLCADCRATTDDAALLAHAAYAMAILYARLYPPPRRDYAAAREWVESALRHTAGVPANEGRIVNRSFLHNTMALIDLRRGRLAEASRRLGEALALLRDRAPTRYRTECPILLHNRARLHTIAGEPEQAIAALTELLGNEPSSSEAYFDRALLLQRAGRFEEALLDCTAAIRWSPPYPEAHFNRAQTLAALGRPDAALADYDRVLELNPRHIESLINRATLRYETGDRTGARLDVARGLPLDPENAPLLCLRGLLELADGQLTAACASFTEAIERQPELADTWANRAAILYKRGDLGGAVRDLTESLRLRDSAPVRYNRGRVFEASELWREAAEDYRRAMALEAGDKRHIADRLARCEQRLQASLRHPAQAFAGLQRGN